jgi:hypothetical protein
MAIDDGTRQALREALQEELAAQKEHRRKLWHKPLAWAAISLLLVASLSGGGYYFYHQHRSQSFYPASVTKATGFPLFYPNHPPASLQLAPTSFSATNEVVTYYYTYSGNKKLIVSVMPLTPGVDISNFNPTKKFTTGIGQAYLVDINTRTTGAIIADKSWILINAPDKISAQDMEAFINSFQPVKSKP